MGGFMGSTLMRWIMYGWMCSMIREWIWSYYGIHSRSTIITREFGMLIYVFRGVSNYSVGCGWFMEKIWETRSVNLDRILNRQQCRPICWITTRMLRRDERERCVKLLCKNSESKEATSLKPCKSYEINATRMLYHMRYKRSMSQDSHKQTPDKTSRPDHQSYAKQINHIKPSVCK